MSNATFIAYIDESGDEGFDTIGCSEWFVLSAVMYRKSTEPNDVKVVDRVRDAINLTRQPNHRIPPKKPLHFRDLSHEQRKLYASEIAKANGRTFVIAVHKASMPNPETLSSDYRLYYYAVRLLIERMSWLCRDAKRTTDPGDGSLDLVFSNRASMSYANLKTYLNYLDSAKDNFDYRVARGVIKPDEIQTLSAGKRMGLQVADAIASGFYYALEKSPYGFTEPAYASLLLPRSYRHKGKVWNYGIKMIPTSADVLRKNDLIFKGWEK